MRRTARGVMIGLLLIGAASAIGVSAQAPSTNPLTGTWKFVAAKSKMNLSLPPRDLTRVYDDRGAGVYIYTQTGHDASGRKVASLYVAKDDGAEYPLIVAGSDLMPAGTISFKRVDAMTAEQTEKLAGVVSATAVRKIAPDGRSMTVTVRARAQGGGQDDAGGTAAGQRERPADEIDIMVFEKQ